MDLRVAARATVATTKAVSEPGRIVAGEEPVRRGYIDIDQPIHGNLPPAGEPDRESHSESQRGPTPGDSQPRRATV
jgi:hypothetical protein